MNLQFAVCHRFLNGKTFANAKFFPDKLQLGRTKFGYLKQFGLTSFNKEKVLSFLLRESGIASRFVSCFIEAPNGKSKRKQMNVHLFLTIPSKKLFGPISGHISRDTTNEIFVS